MKIKICSDVYNISKRIKDIDRSYYVVYDTSKNKFEIHSSNQVGGSYCLTLPFEDLDERALEYVLKTSSTNIDEIVEKIENDNKLLMSTERNSVLSKVVESIEKDNGR